MTHLEHLKSETRKKGAATEKYRRSRRERVLIFAALSLLLFILIVVSILVGSYDLTIQRILSTCAGFGDESADVVIFSLRLPRIAAAVIGGWGLAVSGIVMQTILKNPLGSPFTLGISHGAAFGAAFAIVIVGAGSSNEGTLRSGASSLLQVENVFLLSTMAFAGAVSATVIILILARMRKMTSDAIVLAGVALSSLFMSGTILLQYFASEVELASIVFWTFGDVSRSSWHEIALLSVFTAIGTLYFVAVRWDLNAMNTGEDSARGLGVNVESLRKRVMVIAALISGLVVAFHGVIAFLGLLAPHIARRICGENMTMLIPFSSIIGALILLGADTVGRTLIGSGTLPVGVVTSFLGAPLFLYLLMRGRT